MKPELRTPRLVLRPLLPGDAPAICRYRSLTEVARYQSWETFTVEDAHRLLASQASVLPDTPGTWLQLAIVAGGIVGDLGLHFLDSNQVELGITLDPGHQGKGYATEALRAVLGYLFGTLAKHRVTATTDAENRPAAALFERLGFRREGHYRQNVWFKGRWGDEFFYALLRSEWGETMGEEKVAAYLEPTQEAGRAFLARNLTGPVVMLNLLRFRAVADYSATPHLAPKEPISGAAAYRLYVEHTLPHLEKSGGELVFLGKGGNFLIGPGEERWDAAMLVRQRSVADFVAFAANPEYLAGMGHRLAALEDSRLLPLVEGTGADTFSEGS